MSYPGYIPVADVANRKKVAAVWNVAHEALSGKDGLTTVEIMQAAHSGGIKGMHIMGENPMLTDPNLNHARESIQRLEFLVVQEIFFQPKPALLPMSFFQGWLLQKKTEPS